MQVINFYNLYIGRVVAVLAGVIALSVFLYGALLLGAVTHAAGRNAAENKVRTLSVEVSALEGQFLSETKSLSLEKATAMGFVAPVSVATVYAGKSVALVLR